MARVSNRMCICIVGIAFLFALGLVTFSTNVTNAADGATVSVTSADQFGGPVYGMCVTLTASPFFQQACDAADGTVDGIASFSGIAPGAYALRQSYTPTGFAQPAPNPVPVTVVSGLNTFSLTSNRTDLRITLEDASGNPVLGACFNVTQGSYTRTLCDGASASGGLNGVTLITYASAPSLTLTQTVVPTNYAAMAPQVLSSLVPGSVNELTVVTPLLAQETVTVLHRDQDGGPVYGACARLVKDAFFAQRCDSADGVVDGQVSWTDVPVTSGYSLSQSYTPVGFASPAAQSVNVTLGGPNSHTFTSNRTDLRITLEDASGNPVLGACFNVTQGSYTRTLCDGASASGGLNGVTLITYAPAPSLTLTQTVVPTNYAAMAPQVLSSLVPGSVNELTVVTPLLAQETVTVLHRDQDGGPVYGACARLVKDAFFAQRCDSADGVVDGQVSWTDVPVTSGYSLSQSYTPVGFASPAAQSVNVTLGGPNSHTFTSNRTDLRITLEDASGNPVLGACFNVTQGSYTRTLCDGASASGGLNGVTLITYAPAPSLTLTQTTTPSGFATMAPQSLTALVPGTVNELEVVLSGAYPTITTELVDGHGNVLDEDSPAIDQGDGVYSNIYFTNNSNATVQITAYHVNNLAWNYSPSCASVYVAPGSTHTCQMILIVPPSDRHDGFFDVAARVYVSGLTDPILTTPTRVPVNSSDVEISKAAFHDMELTEPIVPGAAVNLGDTIWYAITVENTGSSKLTETYIFDYVEGSGELYTGCSNRVLMPGESLTCQVSVQVSTAHQLAGEIVDHGRVYALQLDNAAISAELTIPVNFVSVEVTKAAYFDEALTEPVTSVVNLGDEVWYAITVENNGTQELTGVSVGDQIVDGDLLLTNCQDTYLPAGDTLTCAVAVIVTLEDQQVGEIADFGVVQADQLTSGDAVSDVLTIPVAPAPALMSLMAYSDDEYTVPLVGPVDQSDTIYYELTIENVSGTTIEGAIGSIFDDTRGYGSFTTTCYLITIPAGETVTCRREFIVESWHRQALEVQNTGLLTATSGIGDGPPISSNSVSFAVNSASLTVSKAAFFDEELLSPVSGPVDQGVDVYFAITVNNTGASKLTSVFVTDFDSSGFSASSVPGVLECLYPVILAGESETCVFQRTISATDRLNGEHTNYGQVAADQLDSPGYLNTNEVIIPVNSVSATATKTAYLDAELTIPVTGAVGPNANLYIVLAVNNTGDSALTNVRIEDYYSYYGYFSTYNTCHLDTVPAGTSESCVLAWSIHDYEIAEGLHEDYIRVYADQFDGSGYIQSDTLSIPVVEPHLLAVEVTSVTDENGDPVTELSLGQTLRVQYHVRSLGSSQTENVFLYDFEGYVSDDGSGECPSFTALAPDDGVDGSGADEGDCTRTHVVTAGDRYRGSINIYVYAYGNGAVAVLDDPADVTVVVAPGTAMTISGGPSNDVLLNGAIVGDSVTYSYTVTNTGTVPITGIYVFDTRATTADCEFPGFFGILEAGEVATCTAVDTVSQSDELIGFVESEATAYANQIDATSESFTYDVHPNDGAMSVVKVAKDTNGNVILAANGGDWVTYEFTVTNLGSSTTLTGIHGLDYYLDPTYGSSAIYSDVLTCANDMSAPGESVICVISRQIGTGDVARGYAQDYGAIYADQIDHVQSSTIQITATEGDSRLNLTLSNADATLPGNATTVYDLHVTSLGVDDISGITITGSSANGIIDCPATSLTASDGVLGSGPDEMDCTITYDLSVEAAAGNDPFIYSVHATSDQDLGGFASNQITIDLLFGNPEVTRRYVNDIGESITSARLGQTVTVEYTVENLGELPVTNVSVTDGFHGEVCSGVDLDEAGGTNAVTTCSYDHTVTLADLNDWVNGLLHPIGGNFFEWSSDQTVLESVSFPPVLEIESDNSPPSVATVSHETHFLTGSSDGLLNSSSDPDGDAYAVVQQTYTGDDGTSTVYAYVDGTYDYSMTAYNSPVSFDITVEDVYGGSATIDLTITVTNEPPSGSSVTFQVHAFSDTLPDGILEGDVSDPEGDTPINAIAGFYTGTLGGSLFVDIDGYGTYDLSGPNTESFEVGIQDGLGATSTLTVTLEHVNESPVASDAIIYVSSHDGSLQESWIEATGLNDIDPDDLTLDQGGSYVSEDGSSLTLYSDGSGYFTLSRDGASFTIEVTDGHGGSVTFTITLNYES